MSAHVGEVDGHAPSFLIVNAQVYAPSAPYATALYVSDGRVAWIGDQSGAEVHREIADVIVDARGNLITPGFVDSHVHATSAGLLIAGLDLTGVTSASELLAALQKAARDSNGAPLWGHGWDETLWPDPTLPRREDIDRATWGSEVYLSRIDVHSALVSSALVAKVPGIDRDPGWGMGAISQKAHQRVREEALRGLTPTMRSRAQRAFLTQCAARGIVAVHEMAGPGISSFDDAHTLAALQSEGTPEVFLYWGQTADDGGIEAARELGAIGVGGDLFIDGALGSRTAFLREPYADAPHCGAQYLDSDRASAHIIAATESGLSAGFHVIGDAGCDVAIEAFLAAERFLGTAALRRGLHRLEHAEMLTDAHLAVAGNFGIFLGMQPLFDALWGGPNGMYEQRLGRDRAATMNRWGSALSGGVPVTFSSDAPVTPSDPWRIVHAAMMHNNPQEMISARAAFAAMTRASWRVVGRNDSGQIAVGAPAHLAMWETEALEVQAPDSRIERWSTDPRSASPALPALADDLPRPECVMTWRDGHLIFDSRAIT